MALSDAHTGGNARTYYLHTPEVIASLIIATALVAFLLKILYPAGQLLLLLLLERDLCVAQDSTAAVCLCMFHAPNANGDVATSLTALLATVGGWLLASCSAKFSVLFLASASVPTCLPLFVHCSCALVAPLVTLPVSP